VSLSGLGFGADPSLVVVTWNGTALPGVALAVFHTLITFPSPPGQGRGAFLRVGVAGQWTEVLQGDGPPALLQLRFVPPAVARVSLSRRGAVLALDCSRVGPDGRPEGGAATAAVLALEGSNFGDANGTTVLVGGVPCPLVAPPSPTRVLCATPLCLGEVEVAVGGVAATTRPLYNFLQLAQSPVIASVTPLTGPVAGNTVVTIMGSKFGDDAVVVFSERNWAMGLTWNTTLCEWQDRPGMLCDDGIIR
jgi:hypothetical protein